VQKDIDLMPYKIAGRRQRRRLGRSARQEDGAPAGQRRMLRKMKKTAEDYLGEK
jgi:hypothetical protein